MNIVKSARGVDVDFDLLRMKEQMQRKPKDGAVSAREKAVGARRRRGSGKILQKLAEDYHNTKDEPVLEVATAAPTVQEEVSTKRKKITPQILVEGENQ